MARLLPALLLALAGLSVSGAAGTTTAQQTRQASAESAARPAARSSYGALPLAFVPNAGQLDRRVRFSAQAGSASIFLTRREAVLALGMGRRGLALRLRFLGANASPTLSGVRRSAGRVNYLIGNDSARWQTNLPPYREVVYRGLWPGIDLAVGGGDGRLKYEFRLAPGADPNRIRLRYRGQERLALARDGALRVETPLGSLRDSRPLSYQPIEGNRVAVASRFTLGPGGAYGFALGSYDRRYPLVIDPGLVYSTFLGGGGGGAAAVGIAVDRAGSAYVTGLTLLNVPTTAGAFDRSHNGGNVYGGDVFVTKLNPAGSALVYSTYLGGSGDDGGGVDGVGGIAVDANGSAFITGETDSKDFPTTAGAFDRSFNGPRGDSFVAKLNRAGSRLVYSTFLGGRGREYGSGIALDRIGRAVVVGTTGSRRHFPTTVGAFDRTYNGRHDAFVTKLNLAGSALAYSTYLGGSSGDSGNAIARDGVGDTYVTGSTLSADFPKTAGAFDRSYSEGGGIDAFVTKLSASGSALVYSTYLGGSGVDQGSGIAVQTQGGAYVAGSTQSRNFPTTAAAFDKSFNGGSWGPFGDAFVTKLSASGSALVYSTFLGGGDADGADAIAIDGRGTAYVTGATMSRGFPATPGAFDRTHNLAFDPSGDLAGSSAAMDVFVTRLKPSGASLAYSTFVGGTGLSSYYNELAGVDEGSGIAVHRPGVAYVAGGTTSATFPTTASSFDRSYNENGFFGDAFVFKLHLVPGPPNCLVPDVIGMFLTKAKRTIQEEHCSVGRVRDSKSGGRVVSQTPRSGVIRKRGFPINLIVGRR